MQVACLCGQQRRGDSRPEREGAQDMTAARNEPEGVRTEVSGYPNQRLPQRLGFSAGEYARTWPADGGPTREGQARAALGARSAPAVHAPCPLTNQRCAEAANRRDGEAEGPSERLADACGNMRVTKKRIQEQVAYCLDKSHTFRLAQSRLQKIQGDRTTALACHVSQGSCPTAHAGSERVLRWDNGPTESAADVPPANTQPSAVTFVMQSTAVGASRLLSVREAASLLGVCRRTLEREVCRKKFPPPVKIAGKSCYFVSDVEAYVEKARERRGAFA